MNPSLLIAYQAGTSLWSQVLANLSRPRAALWPDLSRAQLYFHQILAAPACPPSYAHRARFYLAEIGTLRYIWSMGWEREDLRNMEAIKNSALNYYNTVLDATARDSEWALLYRSALWGRARLWYLHDVNSLTLEDVNKLLQMECRPRFLLLRSRCFLRQGLVEAAVRDSLVALEWFALQLNPNDEDAARLSRDLRLICEHLKLELTYAQEPTLKDRRTHLELPVFKALPWLEALPSVAAQLGEVWRPLLPSVLGSDLLGYFLHVGEAALQGSDGTVGGEQSD